MVYIYIVQEQCEVDHTVLEHASVYGIVFHLYEVKRMGNTLLGVLPPPMQWRSRDRALSTGTLAGM